MTNVFGVRPEGTPGDEPTPSPASAAPAVPAEPAPVEPEPEEVPEPFPAPAEPDDDDDDAFLAGEGVDGVRLGTKVYKDWNAADHVFRQFAGRAKAESKRRKETEAENERLRVELARRDSRPEPAVSASPAPVIPATTPKRLSERFTDDEVDTMIAEKGPAAAFRHLAQLADSRVEELVDERMAVVQPLVQRNQAVEVSSEIFTRLSQMANQDGSPLFPELDPEDPRSDVVIARWTENLSNPRLRSIAFTDAGVELAVQQLRAEGALESQPQPAPSKKTASPTQRAAAVLQGMGKTSRAPVPAPGPTKPVDLEEAARLAIVASKHPIFGARLER